MDEPLSNLDAKLRVEMRAYIARLHHELRTTTVYVTHDQVEAMTMGDRVAVMRDGRLEQVDEPNVLYEKPANVFVAGFIGSPAMNLVTARLDGDELLFGTQTIALPDSVRDARPSLSGYNGRDLVVGMRPGVFEVSYNGSGAGRELAFDVLLTEALGADQLAHLALNSGDASDMTVRLPASAPVRAGERARLLVDPSHLHVFDLDSELAIT